ncbi:MAG: VanZ family protein [Coriobacteriales bacterium]|jgi:VanZ family protein|nr:VanZ family protein [Coriobacteriales bacterium]
MSTNELRKKPRQTTRIVALVAAILWAVLIFCLSSIPGSGFPSHPNFLNVIAHFGEYLVLAVLLTLALNNSNRALWKTALIALVITSLYGASDEIHQLFTGRNCDPVDWATDTCGALIGVVATVWFISARKVKQSRKRDGEKRSQQKTQ